MLQVVYYVKLRAHCQFIDNHVLIICCIYQCYKLHKLNKMF